jgi:diguanylate cyclase (GGDEF)-like protein
VYFLGVAFWRLKSQLNSQGRANLSLHTHKDDLTGMPTRTALINGLDHLLELSKRDKVNVAMLFIDVDDFNNLNVSLGNKIADILLIRVGEIIKSVAKDYTNHVYHIGSDEFAVVLYDYGNDIDIVNKVANDIMHAISQPSSIEGYELNSSCCIGICVYPECADDTEALVKHAGSARDNAKKIGYGSVSFYTQEMSKKSVMRTLISSDLRTALENNEFYLYYQPKISLRTGEVQGAEALLRWRHPSLGNITPDVFIPAIEDLGLIHPIGKWVIYTACKDMKRLHVEGYPNLRVAINISAHQFNKGDIASVVAEAIWDSGISPNKVELELTEAVVMSDTEKSALMFRVLQAMGVKIAVDDFGTGYSSMNQLTKFPISILKIDQCFIRNMHLNPANHAIVSTMIRMGKQLGFEVVAEGVECLEELEILRNEDCDQIQGFYYSPPLPLAEFIEYVQKSNSDAMPASNNSQESSA